MYQADVNKTIKRGLSWPRVLFLLLIMLLVAACEEALFDGLSGEHNTFSNQGRGDSAGVLVVTESTQIPATASALRELFDARGYQLQSVRDQSNPVPPIFAMRIPPDMAAEDSSLRKDLFLRLALPVLLEVNREIAADRAYLLSSGYQGPVRSASDPRIRAIAERYYASGSMDELLTRVDILPPALMLAQAVVESGWGTSRFAIEGQALYGQWTWNAEDAGIVPSERDAGANHRVRAFASLLDCARAYAVNVNRHSAYQPLRDLRADLSDAEKSSAGHALAAGLLAYSTQGQRYVTKLREVMETNRLHDFGAAGLSNRTQLMVVLTP